MRYSCIAVSSINSCLPAHALPFGEGGRAKRGRERCSTMLKFVALSANTYQFLDIDPFEIFDIRLRRSICADALDMHILCKRDLYHIAFVKRLISNLHQTKRYRAGQVRNDVRLFSWEDARGGTPPNSNLSGCQIGIALFAGVIILPLLWDCKHTNQSRCIGCTIDQRE